jgi:hypothetical protein
MKPFRGLAALFAISSALSCLDVGGSPTWPSPAYSSVLRSLTPTTASDDDLVKQLPVCIASHNWSAGELGRTVLYRYERQGNTLRVGYFVYWSTERPWGDNLLSLTFLPAFFIDAFYSHLFFVFPGGQRFIHGPGDIEGARVTYEQRGDGKWIPVSAVAEDGSEDEVALSPDEFVDEDGRVILMTDVWSHQLGAKGAREFAKHARELSCYAGSALLPMSDAVAEAFRLGSPSDPRRAPPAWKLDSTYHAVAIHSKRTVRRS